MVVCRVTQRFGALGAAFVALRLLSTTSRVMASAADQGDPKTATSVYDFTVNDIKGQPVSMEKYRGHPLIIVNVASKCGYTAQHYKELNELNDEFGESKGLRILAFPCDQFAHQEPGTNEEIECSIRDRKVQFDLFEKVDVNGKTAHPLFEYLKNKQKGTLFDFIKWNFTKFIVDKEGQPAERHGPSTSPAEMKKNLEKFF
uniref:Glutathione peroxidase n=1 Tax=Phlebotomus kandelakii TaxID=1109342 RepID=A0A6B2EFQ1_9DIPT